MGDSTAKPDSARARRAGGVNFYKRFVADIQVKTGHLTPAEFGVYDRLLDHYYATEAPLPGSLDRCCAIARAMTKADRGAVERVLVEFFSMDSEGYRQRRADEMIAEAQPKIEAARTNGKHGGRPKVPKSETQQKPNGLFVETQDEPNAKASQSQSTSNEVLPPTGVRGVRKKALKNCPPDFLVTVDLQRWARESAPLVDIRAETAIFRATERKVAVTDWPKAWQKWMLIEQKSLAARSVNGETAWQRSQRERVAEMSGGLVSAAAPGGKPSPLLEVVQHGPFAIGR